MGKTNELFSLIKSFTKAEKTNFTQSRTQSRISSYLKVYRTLDTIADTEDVTEEYLEKRLTQKKIASLASAKTKLYDELVKSLRNSYDLEDDRIKVNEILKEAYILESKGLYDLAVNHFNKAEKLALKADLTAELIQIKRNQRRIVLERKVRGQKKSLEKIEEELNHLCTSFVDEIAYENLHYQLFSIYRHGKRRNVKKGGKDQSALLLEISENDYFKKPVPQGASFLSKILYENNHAFYHLNKKEFSEAHRYFKNALHVWDDYPEFENIHRARKVIYVSNFLHNLHNQGIYDDEFLEWLTYLENIDCKSFDEEAECFQNTISLRLLFHMNRSEFNDCIRIIHQFDENLEKYKKKINKSRIITIQYNSIICFWMMGDLSSCNDLLFKISQDERSDHRPDLKIDASILSLIVHFELQEYKLLQYKLKNMYNQLRKTERLDFLEKTTIKALESLLAINETFSTTQKEKETIAIVKHIKTQLEDHFEELPQPYSYPLILHWADSKL